MRLPPSSSLLSLSTPSSLLSSTDISWAQEDARSPDGISPIVENTTSFSAQWVVDAPAGTRVSIRLRDAKGHWVKTYAEVYAGKTDECVNLAYPDPTEPARPPPPKATKWARGLEFLALAGVVLLACWGIAVTIRRTAGKEEARGEYIPVSNDIPLARVSGVTRRTPTRHDEEEEDLGREGDEFRSLLPSNKRLD